MKYIIQRDCEGYLAKIDCEEITTTLDFNKIMYFEEKSNAIELAKFLNNYDEFQRYIVKEIRID